MTTIFARRTRVQPTLASTRRLIATTAYSATARRIASTVIAWKARTRAILHRAMRKAMRAIPRSRGAQLRSLTPPCVERVVRRDPQPSLSSLGYISCDSFTRGNEPGSEIEALSSGYVMASMASVLFAAVSDTAPKNSTPLAILTGDKVPYKYVGTKKCRSCHGVWHRSWAKSPKGRSWDALKPGVSDGLKRRVGLDLQKDYRADIRCLKCHSTGFGHDTGYAVPDPKVGRTVRLAFNREGVGCEACHGPGSGFVQVMRDILWNERPKRRDELRAAGLRDITRENCLRCHSLEATCIVPDGTGGTHPNGALDVDLHDRAGFHQKFPLKFRIPSGSGGRKPAKIDPLQFPAERRTRDEANVRQDGRQHKPDLP